MAEQPGTMPGAGEIPATRQAPQQQHRPVQYPMDAHSMWLRSEFVAANAIIDALCRHLQAVGGLGEYDDVVGSIQNRRCNWSHILHMQEHFPVSAVISALQHVEWRRQQGTVGLEGGVRKEVSEGSVNGNPISSLSLNDKSDGEDEPKVEEKTDDEIVSDSCNVDGSKLIKENWNLEVTPKTFVATEICCGTPVNVVDGMKLYEELIENSDISKLITLVNDLRYAGRTGKLQGETFDIMKRPMNGRGREIIQLGNPSVRAPSADKTTVWTFTGLKTEPIPSLLKNVIERLLNEQVIDMKPDSCIIDIYNEGDYSKPYDWPIWFVRPVCVLFLTECEMSFGKFIAMHRPGEYQGALNLSLSPGSMLVMQGRSTNMARYSIPSIQKQRILVTLTKTLPKKTNSSYVHHFPSAAAASSPHRVPPNWPPNNICPVIVPMAAVPAAIASPVGIPAASAGWPHQHLPHLPSHGTGVFLPPHSSGISTSQPGSTENSNASKVNGQVS